jgi:hypothetical protein
MEHLLYSTIRMHAILPAYLDSPLRGFITQYLNSTSQDYIPRVESVYLIRSTMSLILRCYFVCMTNLPEMLSSSSHKKSNMTSIHRRMNLPPPAGQVTSLQRLTDLHLHHLPRRLHYITVASYCLSSHRYRGTTEIIYLMVNFL